MTISATSEGGWIIPQQPTQIQSKLVHSGHCPTGGIDSPRRSRRRQGGTPGAQTRATSGCRGGTRRRDLRRRGRRGAPATRRRRRRGCWPRRTATSAATPGRRPRARPESPTRPPQQRSGALAVAAEAEAGAGAGDGGAEPWALEGGFWARGGRRGNQRRGGTGAPSCPLST